MDEELKDDELPTDIARALSRLDDDATRRTASVDAGRVAERVLGRLRDEPADVTPIRPRLFMPSAMRIAAAALLLVVGGAVAKQVFDRPVAVSEVSWLPAVPESLDAAQESALLAAVDSARVGGDVSVPAVGVTVDDLNEQELQALLVTMDEEGTL